MVYIGYEVLLMYFLREREIVEIGFNMEIYEIVVIISLVLWGIWKEIFFGMIKICVYVMFVFKVV